MEFTLFFQFLVTALICLLAESTRWPAFQWNTRSWPQTIINAPPNAPVFKVVYLKDRLNISCSTNKPYAHVDLLYQRNTRSTKQSALNARPKGRVVQNGHNFIITSVKGSDAGVYTCAAEDPCGTHLTLPKGHLIVLHVVRSLRPEIIPSGPVLIPKHGSYVITCRTKGFGKSATSLIKWYKRHDNGTTNAITSSIVSEKEIRRDLSAVDVEKLVFVNFTTADGGVYVCERKVGGTSTSASVQVSLLTTEKEAKDEEDKRCKDDYVKKLVGFCDRWKKEGLCEKLPLTMEDYCPKTCDLC